VHKSTIYEELKRHGTNAGYDYEEAHKKACEKKKISSGNNKKMTKQVIALVEEKLKLQWSPEQISGWLKRHDLKYAVSYETIYKHVWEDKRKGGTLYKNLRHYGKKYNKRGSGKAGRGCIPGRIDISERPTIVEEKSRVGDFEIDTIIGGEHKGAIVTMVDRCSKFTLLFPVSRKTAEEVEKALISSFIPIQDYVLTITADNGKEFANHLRITDKLGATVYFARPYHSWERGLNEHTNGLIRQYLPKKKRLDKVSIEETRKIEDLLNNRPRKILNYQTPFEVFHEQKAKSATLLF
jgi:transposase, IS30 family